MNRNTRRLVDEEMVPRPHHPFQCVFCGIKMSTPTHNCLLSIKTRTDRMQWEIEALNKGQRELMGQQQALHDDHNEVRKEFAAFWQHMKRWTKVKDLFIKCLKGVVHDENDTFEPWVHQFDREVNQVSDTISDQGSQATAQEAS